MSAFDSIQTRRAFLTSSLTVSAAIAAAGAGLQVSLAPNASAESTRRGDDRLARFYQAQWSRVPREVLAARTVRSFMADAHTTSLRTLIQRTVVAFVPPLLPLSQSPVNCTHAVTALEADGGFTLGAKVEATTSDPVAFILGFCTNDARGAWSAIIGALNFATDSMATSSTPIGVFHTLGASWWLGKNYSAVAATGVRFRIVSTLNPDRTPIRQFFGSWVRAFEGGINLRNILALTDDHPELSVETLDAESTSSIDPDDATLSLRGSLIFE